MTRERGDWIPWYCDDSPGWLTLSLAARGAAEGIARKMGHRSGELHLGAHGLRGLAVLLRCSWEELEPALAELLAGPEPRYVVTEDQRLLIDPQHAERRRQTSRERTAKYRERKAAATPLPAPSPREEIRSEEKRGEVTSHVVDVTSPNVTGVTLGPPDWWETVCDTVEAGTGATIQRGAAWLRYSGHRQSTGKRMSDADARYWLTTVDVREQAQDRQRERVQRDIADQRRNPPEPPKPSREQAKREANAFAAKLLEAKRKAAGT